MATDSGQNNSWYRMADYVLIAVIFALLGGFFWAIRGTTGYGGSAGGTLAGLGWAMLWLGFTHYGGASRKRPYGNGYMIAALTLGMFFGGMTGYGVYTAWVAGKFFLNYPEGLREVAPWTGYAMLFACGLHWGGVTGAFMAWCAPKRPLAAWEWGARIGAGVLGAVLAGVVVRVFPQWFLPFYAEGLYADPDNATCIRAVGSIRNIAPHVGLFLGFLAFELFRRDMRAVKMMLLMGLGFAIPFAVGGYWHNFHGSQPPLDWWKFWEMSIGLGGGLAIGAAFYFFNRPDSAMPPQPVTKREQVFAAALVVTLGVASVFANAYEGVSRLHGLEWPQSVRLVLTLACLLAVAATLTLWIRKQNTGERDAANPRLLPAWMPPAVLLLIVIAGYLVSTPPNLRLDLTSLLVIYTVYIVGSLAAFAALHWRRGGIRNGG